jgi:hypothetical protein
MLSQYSSSEDIHREFFDDLKRADYWLNKYCGRRAAKDEYYDVGCDIFYDGKKMSVSKPQFYTSPKTGNEWMMWWKAVNNDGMPKFSTLLTLYRMTERYMMIMCPTMVCFGEDDVRDGITIYTDHLFMRMHERLGVDMSDRLQVIRNFVNHATETMMDTRPQRKGEQHQQIVCRLPGSWLRGHVEFIGDKHYIIKYRTFYTDRSLTPFQAIYLKSFRKFADKVSTMENFIELEKQLKEKKNGNNGNFSKEIE